MVFLFLVLHNTIVAMVLMLHSFGSEYGEEFSLLAITVLEISGVTVSEILRSESFTRWLVGA